MIFPFREKSEDYLLHRLNDEAGGLNDLVRKLAREQEIKSDLNRRLIYGMREQGHDFSQKLTMLKTRLAGIVGNQCEYLKEIEKRMAKIKHLLNLLIYMEQVSLAIHTGRKKDDLSDMIDVNVMPIKKFRKELEHIKMLDSSFEIMKIDLEKQKGYINAFDLDPQTLEERYFFESSKEENRLSEEEVVSASQLGDFCQDLKVMIDERMQGRHPHFSESDRAAHAQIEELRSVKLGRTFFSPGLHRFIRRLVSRNVRSRSMRKLVTFLILFLLSRLKKFRPNKYLSQLRCTILAYNLLCYMHTDRSQRDIITGATLISGFPDLSPSELEDAAEGEELEIIRRYFKSVSQLFDEELAFVNTLISYYNSGSRESPVLPWAEEGARVMGLVFDFDKVISEMNFSQARIADKKEELSRVLEQRHKGCGKEISWLISEWRVLLPQQLTDLKRRED